jgi:hypothetical protein
MSDVYDTHLQGIVCISGTNRPDNYTARALGIVVGWCSKCGDTPTEA